MISLIMVCSLVGTVLLIGVRAPLSAAAIPPATPRNDPPQIVIEEPLQDDWQFTPKREDSVPGESTGDNAIRDDLREWIARSSIPTLRSRGMTDEEIKAELLRDFSLTEEQIDEILAAQ